MSQQSMQVELFEGTNALITAWMKRRQEAVETGLAALQKMSAAQDPALAARICADWMGGSLNRMSNEKPRNPCGTVRGLERRNCDPEISRPS